MLEKPFEDAMKILSAILLITSLLIACESPMSLEKPTGGIVLFETVLKSSNRLYEHNNENRTEPRSFIFNSSDELNAYLDTKIGEEQDFQLLRSIDFVNNSLVVVDLPAQVTGFIQIEITSIVHEENMLNLYAERLVPGDHAVTNDIGYPVHAVVIEKSSSTVAISEIKDVVSQIED